MRGRRAGRLSLRWDERRSLVMYSAKQAYAAQCDQTCARTVPPNLRQDRMHRDHHTWPRRDQHEVCPGRKQRNGRPIDVQAPRMHVSDCLGHVLIVLALQREPRACMAKQRHNSLRLVSETRHKVGPRAKASNQCDPVTRAPDNARCMPRRRFVVDEGVIMPAQATGMRSIQ